LFCQFTYIWNVIFGCLTNCYFTMTTFEISVDYDGGGGVIFFAHYSTFRRSISCIDEMYNVNLFSLLNIQIYFSSSPSCQDECKNFLRNDNRTCEASSTLFVNVCASPAVTNVRYSYLVLYHSKVSTKMKYQDFQKLLCLSLAIFHSW
ncbi:hypothetical protein T06_9031, partial [Trichinella sp. T6]